MFEKSADFAESRLLGLVGDLLDRYIHINRTDKFDREKLSSLYLPIEKYLLDEMLSVKVIVPILFLKFDFTTFRINKAVSLEKLSDELHLARGWRGRWGDSNNSLVESAATHALFISGCSIENCTALGEERMSIESYPIGTVETFFAAIRTCTHYATGYAEVLALPIGWASGYTADLIPITRISMQSYPPIFEEGAWRDEAPMLALSQANEIGTTFEGLLQILETERGRKLHVATNRLNLSSMRTTDEDGIIDAMIAIEALLSDGNQEMTHKVAMRLAALYKLLDISDPNQIFKEMKDIYKVRSRIVHGGADLDKSRKLNRDGAEISTVDAALEHLRTALSTLIKNPVLLDPKTIDSYLLTGKF